MDNIKRPLFGVIIFSVEYLDISLSSDTSFFEQGTTHGIAGLMRGQILFRASLPFRRIYSLCQRNIFLPVFFDICNTF